MKTGDFDYELPPELIAQTPAEPRDSSRLMVVNRAAGSIEHHTFRDLPRFLREGDVAVFNDSRVIPARLYGRSASGGRIELLLLRRIEPGVWRALVRPGRRLRTGATFVVASGGREVAGEVLDVQDDGPRTVRLADDGPLDEIGIVPLPPYIREPLTDSERYQTVYSRVAGSVAAPTAGLHFTPALLDELGDRGVELVFVTLHVGWDSFRPVSVEDVADHRMHAEQWELDPPAAAAISAAKREGRRVVSVGTTAVRLLEQAAAVSATDHDAVGSGRRLGRPVHLPGVRVQGDRHARDQLPPAPIVAADAHQRIRRPRAGSPRLRGGGAGAVPLLQLRRRDVDSG